MKRSFFILALLCFNAFIASAQESDSVLYRKLRMNWVEELKKIHHTDFTFVYDEKIISLEDYLNMPEDSIYGSKIHWASSPNPLYYLFSYGRAPERCNAFKENSDTVCTQFYISGGIPPRFREGEDSLKKYLNVHRQVPDDLYKGDCKNLMARVSVYCFVDEDGHVWDVQGDKIQVFYPVICDIDIGKQFKNPVGRLTNSGAFSKDFGELLSRMAQDAIRIVKEMSDFKPGEVYLKPVKYRIPIDFTYMQSGPVIMDYGL